MTQPNVRSFRDVLVYLSVGDNAPARLGAATALAKQHGARLIGVEVNHPSVYDTDRAPAAVELAETFQREAEAAGLDSVFHAASRADTVGWKALYAHYADIVVAPTASEADAGLVLRGVPEDVMLNAGVPVLVIPGLWKPQPLGRRVVVSWNASREATRAVHDALPILTRADSVVLFAFDARHNVLKEETDLLRRHLAAHGIEARPFTWPDVGNIDPVDALFSCLSEEDCDMIVAGGYGHPRFLERLMGGATRLLMHTLTLPVLMSH
jgi:nucleotide-binding universal stress UspA family protein